MPDVVVDREAASDRVDLPHRLLIRREAPLADRLLYLGIVFAVLGVAVQSLSHLGNELVFDGDIGALSADRDGNTFAWASAVATFTAGFVLFLLALSEPFRAGRLLAGAAVLAFLSLDDVVGVHERLGTAVRDDVFGLPTGWGRLTWPVLLLPLLALTFVVLWQVSQEAAARAGRFLRIGLGLLALAVLVEVATAPLYIGDRDDGWPGDIEVVLEEAAELAGWILIAAGLSAIAVTRLQRSQAA